MSYKNKYKNRVSIKKARSPVDYVKYFLAFFIIMGIITISCYWFLFKYHQRSLLAEVQSCKLELAELKELNSKLFKEKTVLEQKLHVKEGESLAIRQDLLKSYEDKSNLEKKITLYKKVIKNKG